MPSDIEKKYGLNFDKLNPHFPKAGVYRYIEGGTDFPYPRTLADRGYIYRDPNEIMRTLTDAGFMVYMFHGDLKIPCLYMKAGIDQKLDIAKTLWECGFRKCAGGEVLFPSIGETYSKASICFRQNPVDAPTWDELSLDEQIAIRYPDRY